MLKVPVKPATPIIPGTVATGFLFKTDINEDDVTLASLLSFFCLFDYIEEYAESKYYSPYLVFDIKASNGYKPGYY